jgi:hypothetical protein
MVQTASARIAFALRLYNSTWLTAIVANARVKPSAVSACESYRSVCAAIAAATISMSVRPMDGDAITRAAGMWCAAYATK